MDAHSSHVGEVATLEATILDAAARGDVADELRRSESLHRTLTANLPDTTMFLLDRDMRILIAEGEGLRALPGLIIDLGRWVLETACRQDAIWQRRFGRPLKMFVNVSGRQIADPLFPVEVAEIVRRSGLRPGTLGLEVTESVLIDEAGRP